MNKKNNKGFTLAELLAVIVILTIIIALASSSIMSIMNKSREGLAEEVRNNLKEAALSYSLDKVRLKKCATSFNPQSLSSSDSGCYTKVTVDILLKDGSFEDSHGFCNKDEEIIVYRYNDGTNSDYRAYLNDNACTN